MTRSILRNGERVELTPDQEKAQDARVIADRADIAAHEARVKPKLTVERIAALEADVAALKAAASVKAGR